MSKKLNFFLIFLFFLIVFSIAFYIYFKNLNKPNIDIVVYVLSWKKVNDNAVQIFKEVFINK